MDESILGLIRGHEDQESYDGSKKNAILASTAYRVGDNSIQFSVNPKGESEVDGISIIA